MWPSIVTDEQHFWCFSSCVTDWMKASIRAFSCFSKAFRVHPCLPRQEVLKNNTILIQKMVAMIFLTLLYFFFLGVSCGTILTSTAWTGLESCVCRLYHPWQFVMGSCHFVYCIMQKIRGGCFPCHIPCIRQHSQHPVATDLGIARLSNDCHYTALTSKWDGA